ncbi:hypothetical protein RIF29_13328 [Crotalaria pallida]|uniref:GRF-type domain-containing protein n=1 Tax=Crotalaria pallida TaxID=3830 RepID=A0AAN9P2Y5_CROPI
MASRFSSSSNSSRRRVCRCGNTPIVMTSRTPKNPGRRFWRCPNWEENPHGHYFEWTDCEVDGESSVQPSMQPPNNIGDSNELDDGYWKEKCLKLRKKLADERERTKMLLFVLLITWVVAFGCTGMCLMKCH